MLPGPNQLARDGDRIALWQGPNEWLVAMPRDEARVTAQRMSSALQGETVIVTDVSGRLLQLSLSGSGLASVLAQGTSVELNENRPLAHLRFAGIKATLFSEGKNSVRLTIDRFDEPCLRAWFETLAARTE
jgi:heterotetrameric sarcosine oxidase gamma subunit